MKLFNKKENADIKHIQDKEIFLIAHDFSGNVVPYINIIQLKSSKNN